MNIHLYKIVFVFLIGFSYVAARAQPFASEINDFKKQDSTKFPKKRSILFVGSSSFTKWTDVQDYFPGYRILNRGFGGSSLPDVIHYANDIIFPYKAKQIVIYCGENDLAASDTVSGELVFERFKTLFEMIRKNKRRKNIVFVSLKPSPSRAQLMNKDEIANNLIKDFIAKQKRAAFVDVYHKMLTPEGRPIPDIFLNDSLHMNAKGYVIWQKEIQPYLKK
jgi:lysophospholipase L1-like esterase